MSKREIVFEVKDWTQKRTVRLDKSTLLSHVLRFHYESAFVVDTLKQNFSRPICVIRNERHGTENAVYEIATGGHPLLLVSIQFTQGIGKLAGKGNFIKTFYGIESTGIPTGPVLWGNRI